jgi:hypothetical protein
MDLCESDHVFHDERALKFFRPNLVLVSMEKLRNYKVKRITESKNGKCVQYQKYFGDHWLVERTPVCRLNPFKHPPNSISNSLKPSKATLHLIEYQNVELPYEHEERSKM